MVDRGLLLSAGGNLDLHDVVARVDVAVVPVLGDELTAR
jgi:hypothetical protein